MLRFWVILLLTSVVKYTAVAQHTLQDLHYKLTYSEDVAERLQLQEELILFKDSNSIEFLRQTASMDRSVAETYQNLYQLTRYFVLCSSVTDSARRYFGKLKAVDMERDSLMLCKEAILYGQILRSSSARFSLKPVMVRYTDYINRNSNDLPVPFKQEYYTRLSRLYHHEYNLDSASHYLQLAQRAQVEPGAHPVLQYRTSIALAQLFTTLGDYTSALKELERIKPIARDSEVPYDKAIYHAVMGRVLSGLFNDDLALIHFDTSIQLAEMHRFNDLLRSGYPNRFIVLAGLGRYEDAVTQFNHAVSWFRKHQYETELPGLMLNKAEMELQRENFEAARTDLDSALVMATRFNQKALQQVVLGFRATLEHEANNPESALDYLEQIDTVILARSQPRLMLSWYNTKANILAGLGRFEEAYALAQLYKVYNDSVNSQEQRHQVVTNRIVHGVERLESELKVRETELATKEAQRRELLAWLIGVIIFVLLGTALGFVIYLNAKNKELVRVTTLERDVILSKLQTLQSRVNPHFIFNSLNTLQYLIKNKDYDKGQEYIGQFSLLLRQILYYSGEEVVPMEAEITLLKTYLSIEVERLEKKVEFNIEVGPNIDVTQLGIPPMVLQPLLENALWHGIAPSDRPGEVQLRFEAHELKGIQVSLEDNGVGYHGRDREQHGVNKAFGLNSIDKRMQYISQAYNFESSFAIENRSSEVQCGTRQVLVMPRIQI